MATTIVVCVTVIVCAAMACSVALRAIDVMAEIRRPRSLADIFGGRRGDEDGD